jgi:hypothetical protein
LVINHGPASVRGNTISFASEESVGTSQRKRTVAAKAPINCVTIKPGASSGRIPANVSVNALASVTAGLAKEVDAVNQYAPVMYRPTATGTASERSREQRPNDAKEPKSRNKFTEELTATSANMM